VALVEGGEDDLRVLDAACSSARGEQRIVMLRVHPLVERSLTRGPLSGARIEPWERMDAMERSALQAMRELRDRAGLPRATESIVRFGNVAAETAAVAESVHASRVVAAGGKHGRRLAERLSARFAPDPKLAALAKMPAFEGLSRSARRVLARHLDRVTVKSGATLMREGSRNQTFWVLLEGAVDLSVHGMKARRFEAGDVIGATSMLDGVAATGTAVAVTDVEALVAGPEDFRALEADPEIEARLAAASRAVLRSEILALKAAA
jgi:hypothetical protein